MIVCDDTGISHVAATVKKPSVAISMAENPARWPPLIARGMVCCAGVLESTELAGSDNKKSQPSLLPLDEEVLLMLRNRVFRGSSRGTSFAP
jgi:ADP-heptose:LPS heptosyltransferase